MGNPMRPGLLEIPPNKPEPVHERIDLPPRTTHVDAPLTCPMCGSAVDFNKGTFSKCYKEDCTWMGPYPHMRNHCDDLCVIRDKESK